MKKAPIVSLHYKRPEHTLRSLSSLADNEGASESELYIFCDGAKSEKDEAGVKQVREIVKSRQWCGKVEVIERDRNLGCFQNTVSAVTEICNHRDRVIFTEDDSLLSPQFLNYMNDALEKYQDESKVMQISAYLWPLSVQLPETFFLKLPNVWTFATWRRAWQQYHTDATALLATLRQNKLEQEFTIEGTRPYIEILDKEAAGENDDWSIYWAAIVFLNGLTLYPCQSLVKNIGFDGTGFHFNFATSVYDTVLCQERVTQFADILEENCQAKKAVIEYFQSIQPRRGSLWERGNHKLKKLFRAKSKVASKNG